MKKQLRTGGLFLGAGILVFFARYVPIILQERLIIDDRRISIEHAARSCKTTLGSHADYCSWATGVDVLLIVVAVALVGYGVYVLKTNK